MIVKESCPILMFGLGRVFKPFAPPHAPHPQRGPHAPPLKRGENRLKVPLFKGDLGGSESDGVF